MAVPRTGVLGTARLGSLVLAAPANWGAVIPPDTTHVRSAIAGASARGAIAPAGARSSISAASVKGGIE